ncbi:MAG: hypothetical protein ABSE00_11205 [Chitinispirillaceae bacterium]
MNPRVRAIFQKILPASLLAALMCSCGIFSPRQSQTPNGNGTTDPLNFSAIGGTQYPFPTLQYEDLFQGDDPIYNDENSRPSTKAALIARLNQIANAYPHIQVNWTVTDWIPNSSDDSVTVNVGKYDIILNTSTNPSDTAGSGTAIFILVQNAGWHISSWTDYPAQGVSFFSPNYNQ